MTYSDTFLTIKKKYINFCNILECTDLPSPPVSSVSSSFLFSYFFCWENGENGVLSKMSKREEVPRRSTKDNRNLINHFIKDGRFNWATPLNVIYNDRRVQRESSTAFLPSRDSKTVFRETKLTQSLLRFCRPVVAVRIWKPTEDDRRRCLDCSGAVLDRNLAPLKIRCRQQP